MKLVGESTVPSESAEETPTPLCDAQAILPSQLQYHGCCAFIDFDFARTLERAKSKTENERDAAIKALAEASRECGLAEGKLEASERAASTESDLRDGMEKRCVHEIKLREKAERHAKEVEFTLAVSEQERNNWRERYENLKISFKHTQEFNAQLMDGNATISAERDALAAELSRVKEERDDLVIRHDKLVERSVGAMAIADGDNGHEAIVRDCPMLEAVSRLRFRADQLASSLQRQTDYAIEAKTQLVALRLRGCAGTDFVSREELDREKADCARIEKLLRVLQIGKNDEVITAYDQALYDLRNERVEGREYWLSLIRDWVEQNKMDKETIASLLVAREEAGRDTVRLDRLERMIRDAFEEVSLVKLFANSGGSIRINTKTYAVPYQPTLRAAIDAAIDFAQHGTGEEGKA